MTALALMGNTVTYEGYLLPNPEHGACAYPFVLVNPCLGSQQRVTFADFDMLLELSDHRCLAVTIEAVGGDWCPTFPAFALKAYAVAPTTLDCPFVPQTVAVEAEKDGDAIVLSWTYWACQTPYDVIRGDLGTWDGTDLGAVECLEDGTSDLEMTDATWVEPGAGFFYLLRDGGPLGSGHYGLPSAGPPLEPESGDCPAP